MNLLYKLKLIIFFCISLLLIIIFIKLGLWQLNKRKILLNEIEKINYNYDSQPDTFENLMDSFNNFDMKKEWKSFKIQGFYDYKNQKLIPNKILNGQRGYEIITPFKIINNLQDKHPVLILINRGWISEANERNNIIEDITKHLDKEHVLIIKLLKLYSKKQLIQNKIPYFNGRIQLEDSMEYTKNIPNCNLQNNIYGILTNEFIIKNASILENRNLINKIPKPSFLLEKSTTHLSYGLQWFIFAILLACFNIFILKNYIFLK